MVGMMEERELFIEEVRQLDSFNFYEFSVYPFEFNEETEMFYFPPTQLLWETWLAAKSQAVQQAKQDLLDRVNARWQLAHEQCAENWNTYSSAQMDAFDWVEQDIDELFGEAQEQSHESN